MAVGVHITASGIASAAGLTAESTAVAHRCGISNFKETGFKDYEDEWLVGSTVELEEPSRGAEKLVSMLMLAINECLENRKTISDSLALIICVSSADTAGRPNDLESILTNAVSDLLDLPGEQTISVVANGKVAGLYALNMAADMFANDPNLQGVIVAGVDSYLNVGCISRFLSDERLLATENSDGFIPGEAAAAVLLETKGGNGPAIEVNGLGFACESATIYSEQPLRAEGLTTAISSALDDAGKSIDDMAFRMMDVSGEKYGFKESALALTRLMTSKREQFPTMHITDSVGEIGAAFVPAALGVLLEYGKRDWLPGTTFLQHAGNDDGQRAAAVLSLKE